MPQQLLLSVPNSNPNSAFAKFEIWLCQDHNLPVSYAVFAAKEDDVTRITTFPLFEQAKEFLVDLNGPLPESDEDE